MRVSRILVVALLLVGACSRNEPPPQVITPVAGGGVMKSKRHTMHLQVGGGPVVAPAPSSADGGTDADPR